MVKSMCKSETSNKERNFDFWNNHALILKMFIINNKIMRHKSPTILHTQETKINNTT